jgi:hypothetical protein
MRRALLFVLSFVFSLVFFNSCKDRAWENQDWITGCRWTVTMDLNSPRYAEWKANEIPFAIFKPVLLPSENTIYCCRLLNERFRHYYRTDLGGFFELGNEKDEDGNTNELMLIRRDNFKFIKLVNKRTDEARQWGRRSGGECLDEYPLVGIWGLAPHLFEFRLVKPANYIYFMEIDKEIPGFAIRAGTYLFKQVGDTVFESEATFSDSHIRLEIRDEKTLVLKPLFKLPAYEGLLEPLVLQYSPQK